MTQRIDNIEKGLETNKEDIAQTKESVTTVRAGVESLQISVPKLEARVTTVENTNVTIIETLQRAKKRREQDKDDIQRWCTGRSSVPNKIVALPTAVSPNATTTSQLTGSTRKSYLRRIFGGFGDDSEQRQDIEAGHANKKHKSAPLTAETSMQSTLSDNTKPVTDTAMQDQSQLSANDIQLQELHPTAEEIARYMARTREYNEL